MEEVSNEPEFAEVLLDSPSRQLDRPFTYGIPPSLAGRVGVGSVVVVPFNRSLQVGYVLALRAEAGLEKVKDISRLADRYLTPLSQVFRLVTPPGRGRSLVEEVRLLQGGEDGRAALHPRARKARQVMEALEDAGGSLSLKALKSRAGGGDLGSTLRKMEDLGLVERAVHLSSPRVDGGPG